jgi:hypothetical protein
MASETELNKHVIRRFVEWLSMDQLSFMQQLGVIPT